MKVRAVVASDLHLQAKPPVARSGEPDWFAAMAKPLKEITDLANNHQCPVLYAGDIFDRWNAGPEVINFALKHLPPGWAVPGQHDLPNHNYAEMHRSAYGTLVAAGLIRTIPPDECVLTSKGLAIHGFPWGFEPKPLKNPHPDAFHIALIHRYVWVKGCGYPGADEAARLSTKNIQGYHVAAYGDNHMGFIAKPKKESDPWVINCGGFMRRTAAEVDYQPGVGLLMEDGTVTRHYLNITGESMTRLTAAEEAVGQTLNMAAFVDDLKTLGAGDALDFEAAMHKFLDQNETRQAVRKVILNGLGK